MSFKFSYAFTDYFGAGTQTGFKDDTKGTYYPELNAAYPLPWVEGLSLVGHLGYTKYNEELAVANANGKTDPSYADWKLGVELCVERRLDSRCVLRRHDQQGLLQGRSSFDQS